MARVLAVVGWSAVLVAFGLVPLVFLSGGAYQESLPKLTLLALLAIVIVATLVVRWVLVRPVVPWAHLLVPIGALIVITIAAAFLGVSASRSFLGINGRYAGVVPLLAVVVVAWGIVAFTWDRPTRLWSLVFAGAASAVLGTVAILASRAGVSLPGSPASPRPDGLLGNADFSGAHLALMLPLVLIARRRLPARLTTTVWVVAGLLGVAIVMTQSRGAMLAAIVGVAVLGLVEPDLVLRPVTIVASVLGAGALAVVLVGSAVQWSGGNLPLPKGGLFGSGTLNSRVDYWAGATTIVGQHPLLGTGPDTFSLTYPAAARPTASRIEAHDETGPSGEKVQVTSVVLSSSPHDIYLERAVGSGLLGLGAYLTVVVAALVFSIRAIRTTPWGGRPGHPRRVLLAGFVAMLAGYLTQGITSIDIAPMTLLGWVALGAIATLADPGVRAARVRVAADDATADNPVPDDDPVTHDRIGAGPSTPAGLTDDGADEEPTDLIGPEAEDHWRRDPSGLGLGASTAIGVAAVAALVLALGPLRADRELAATITSGPSGAAAFSAALDAATDRAPFETDLTTRAAAAEADRARSATPADRDRLLASGLRRVDAALERAPDDLDLLTNRAAFLRKQGEAGDLSRFVLADEAYGRLDAVDPYGPDVDVLWARLLAVWAKAADHDPALAERARTTADRAETKVQAWAAGWYTLALARQDLGDLPAARAAVGRALELQPTYPAARKLADQLAAGPPP